MQLHLLPFRLPSMLIPSPYQWLYRLFENSEILCPWQGIQNFGPMLLKFSEKSAVGYKTAKSGRVREAYGLLYDIECEITGNIAQHLLIACKQMFWTSSVFTFLLGLVTLNWKLSGRRSALKDLTSDLLERQKMPQDHFLRHDCHYVKIQHETLKLEKKIEAVEESLLEIQERAWGGGNQA